MNQPRTNTEPASAAYPPNVWPASLCHGTLAAGLISDIGIWQECNDSLCAFLGYPPGMLRGACFDGVVRPDDVKIYLDERRRLHEGTLYSVRANRIFVRKDGSHIWGEIFLLRTATPTLLLAQVTVAGYDRARWQRTCLLADLLSRAEGDGAISVPGQASRRTGRERAVLFCDIAGGALRQVSESVKSIVASRIRSSLRKTDQVSSRSAGNDLMVILNGLHGLGDALTVAEKLSSCTATPISFPGGEVSATITIGVTMAGDSDAAVELVTRADEAMLANRFVSARVLAI